MHQYQNQHQHTRPQPSTALPPHPDHTHPARSINSRDRRPSSPASGSSEDFVPDGGAAMLRLNQVIQNFHTKAALIILHSRAELSPAYSTKTNEIRVNKWFNIELDETDDYLEDIKIWKRIDIQQERPPPLHVEVYLTTDLLSPSQRLVILDDEQKRWDVYNALEPRSTRNNPRSEQSREILLERWTVELGDSAQPIPSDLAAILPQVYKKSIVLFRALFTYCNFLPAWKLIRKLGRSRSTTGMKVGFRIVDGDRLDSIARADNLNTPLYESSSDVVTEYSFGSTDSPAGPFSVTVNYRSNCDFRVDETEELFSSRLISLDNDPVSSRAATQKVGSLPTDQRRNLMQRPELGHAYGSLSTFHQAGIEPGTSPMSALRAQREYGSGSPSPQSPLPEQAQPQRPTAARATSTTTRRSSFNIQPFKTPTLAASPLSSSPLAASPRVSTRAVPTLGSLEEEVSSAGIQPSTRLNSAAGNTLASVSPRPAPAPRFQSSFSHRKRLSVDRPLTKTDEDQSSSGKASPASSAQPGSGLMVDPGGDASSGSMQADDENISDFLKMLDLKKDLLSPSSPTAVESSAKRTAAALTKFHKMRDSNAALSESMSSSLIVPKPAVSAGRHATSTSTSPGGKPVSPHAPHTPFAPSRLSAAYSHDDPELQDTASPAAGTKPSSTQEDQGGIDIPKSPRPFVPSYRRSSSVQRGPISSDDDIADLYGMRSASMGAKLKSDLEPSDEPTQLNLAERRTDDATSFRDLGPGQDGAVSDSGSARSSFPTTQRSRLASVRGTVRDRGDSHNSPTQGSLSSVSGTGMSVERDRTAGADSGSSVAASWSRGGRTKVTVQKPGIRASADDDDELPFIMDSSSMQSAEKK